MTDPAIRPHLSARRASRRGSVAAWVAACLLAAHGPAALAQGGSSAPATSAPSKAAPADPHRRDDVVRHRAIAAAHEGAARCLEAGRPEADCHAALRKACEGIAVGRYCGMKHVH